MTTWGTTAGTISGSVYAETTQNVVASAAVTIGSVRVRVNAAGIYRLKVDGVEVAQATASGTQDLTFSGITVALAAGTAREFSVGLVNGGFTNITFLSGNTASYVADGVTVTMGPWTTLGGYCLPWILGTVVDSYGTSVLADSPAAYWPLDEASGSFGDDSGNGKTLAWVSGGVGTQGDPGPFSGALAASLNGSTNRLESNLALASITDATIELWYKGTDASGVLASARTASDRSITLLTGYAPLGGVTSGQLAFGVSGASLWQGVGVPTTINDNVWHHIVAVWDGTTGAIVASQFKVFVDGVSYPATALSGAGGLSAPFTTGPYTFGHNASDNAAGYLSGSVAQIATYPTALTKARIQAHYLAGGGVIAPRPGPATGALSQAILDRAPLAYYRLSEPTGMFAYDSTTAERDGSYVAPVTRAVASITPSEPGAATDFSGGRVSVNYEPWMGVDYISAFARVKPDTISGNDTIVCQDFNGTATQLAWRLRLAGGKVEAIIRTGGSTYTLAGATTLTAGQAYTVGMTYDGTNVRVFVNGAVDNTLALTGVLYRSDQGIHIGALGATTEPFDGVIDEVAIWSGGLTTGDMAALHTAAIAPPGTSIDVTMGATLSALQGSFPLTVAHPTLDVILAGSTDGYTGSIALQTSVEMTMAAALPDLNSMIQAIVADGIPAQLDATFSLDGQFALQMGAPVAEIEVSLDSTTGLSGSFALGVDTPSQLVATLPPLSAEVVFLDPLSMAASVSFSGAVLVSTSWPRNLRMFAELGEFSGGFVVTDAEPMSDPVDSVAVVRWTFTDVETGEKVTLPFNPNKATAPEQPRNMKWAWGSAWGLDRMRGINLPPGSPAEWTFDGLVRTKDHHDLLLQWSERSSFLRITDHLGWTFEVMVRSFELKETRPTPRSPWKGTYTMTCLLLKAIEP